MGFWSRTGAGGRSFPAYLSWILTESWAGNGLYSYCSPRLEDRCLVAFSICKSRQRADGKALGPVSGVSALPIPNFDYWASFYSVCVCVFILMYFFLVWKTVDLMSPESLITGNKGLIWVSVGHSVYLQGILIAHFICFIPLPLAPKCRSSTISCLFSLPFPSVPPLS